MAVSWLLYTNLQNKTQCVGFFAQTYKTKHTKEGSLLFQDRNKVNIGILFQKVCRRRVGNKNVLGGKKNEKLISGEGELGDGGDVY